MAKLHETLGKHAWNGSFLPWYQWSWSFRWINKVLRWISFFVSVVLPNAWQSLCWWPTKQLPSTLASWIFAFLSIELMRSLRPAGSKFIDYASSFGLRIYGTASEILPHHAVEGEPMQMYCPRCFSLYAAGSRLAQLRLPGFSGRPLHFTLPVRICRYPDLLSSLVRIQITAVLRNSRAFGKWFQQIATQSSNRERRAMRLSVKSKPWKRLSTWKNTWVKSDAVVSSIVNGLLLNCQTRLKAWFTSQIWPEFYHFNERDFDLRGGEIKQPSVSDSRFAFGLKELRDKMTGEIGLSLYPKWVWCDWKGLKQSNRNDRGRVQVVSFR